MHNYKTKAGINPYKKDTGLAEMKLPGFYKTRYISIDQSLAFTCVIAADYKLYIKRALVLPTYKDLVLEARINQLGNLLDGVLKIEGGYLKFVSIELPAFNASGLRDVLHACYWECRRRIYLHDPDLEIISVPIGSWKKYVVGNGRAKKPQIKAEIEKRYNQKFHSQDLYDSYGILRWALGRYKGEV